MRRVEKVRGEHSLEGSIPCLEKEISQEGVGEDYGWMRFPR